MMDQRQPLGQLLVEAGLLTEAALREALVEQQRTQRPLGEVLIRQGYVSPAAVANALADQHGGLLRTEYGIATGLRRKGAESASDAPLAPPVHAGAPSPPRDAIADHAAELARRFGGAPARAEDEPPAAALRVAEPEEAPPTPQAASVDEVVAALNALDGLLSEVEQRARELDALAQELEGRGSIPPTPVASPLAAVAPEAEASERHMLLVPTPNGTELVARTGPPPPVGSAIDLFVAGELVRFAVDEIGPAPLPGPYLPCARLARS